jgi:hypothetical protein
MRCEIEHRGGLELNQGVELLEEILKLERKNKKRRKRDILP